MALILCLLVWGCVSAIAPHYALVVNDDAAIAAAAVVIVGVEALVVAVRVAIHGMQGLPWSFNSLGINFGLGLGSCTPSRART